MASNPNESAFPHPGIYNEHTGLTKREYFAAMALQGLCSGLRIGDSLDLLHIEFSETAIKMADELLKQLDAGGKKN